jgi:hypothetical protein
MHNTWDVVERHKGHGSLWQENTKLADIFYEFRIVDWRQVSDDYPRKTSPLQAVVQGDFESQEEMPKMIPPQDVTIRLQDGREISVRISNLGERGGSLVPLGTHPEFIAFLRGVGKN